MFSGLGYSPAALRHPLDCFVPRNDEGKPAGVGGRGWVTHKTEAPGLWWRLGGRGNGL